MKNNKPIVMIMAGGSGTRLWPISRKKNPKQLIRLYSKNSLIEETIKRAKQLTLLENIIIGTNASLKKKIQKKIKYLKDSNFLVEPVARNTAPIIAFFISWLKEKGISNSTDILILSADHYIYPVNQWIQLIKESQEFLGERIWCFGIKPTRSETGYGYIEIGEKFDFKNGNQIKAFHEKPKQAKAEEYISSDKFLWNSGMFLAKLKSFEHEFMEHAPQMYKLANQCALSKKNTKKYFPKMDSIPFDIAIMEKTLNAGVLLSDFIWDDVGSYESLSRIWKPDENENYIMEFVKYESIDSTGNIILSDTKKIKLALNGIKNSLIVINKDILFISSRSDPDGVKKMRDLFDEKDQ